MGVVRKAVVGFVVLFLCAAYLLGRPFAPSSEKPRSVAEAFKWPGTTLTENPAASRNKSGSVNSSSLFDQIPTTASTVGPPECPCCRELDCLRGPPPQANVEAYAKAAATVVRRWVERGNRTECSCCAALKLLQGPLGDAVRQFEYRFALGGTKGLGYYTFRRVAAHQACLRILSGGAVSDRIATPTMIDPIEWSGVNLFPRAKKKEALGLCGEKGTTPEWPTQGEGVCLPSASNILSHLSAEDQRIVDEMDRADAEEWKGELPVCAAAAAVSSALNAPTTGNGTPREEGGSHRGPHRMVEWMRKTRWLLKYHAPIVNETSEVEVEEARFRFNLSTEADLSKDPQGGQNTEIKIVATLDNVCISSTGGGLSGYGLTQTARIAGFRDEMLYPLPALPIHPRATMPRHLIPTPVFLAIGSVTNSNNLGHILFRMFSLHGVMRLMGFEGKDDAIIGFYMNEQTAEQFGHMRYALFYQAFNRRWFAMHVLNERTNESSIEENDLCFRRVYISNSHIFLWPPGWPFIAAATRRNAAVIPGFRKKIFNCYEMNETALDFQRPIVVPTGNWSNAVTARNLVGGLPVRVTFLSRSHRRLRNELQLITELARRYKKQPLHFVWNLVNFEEIPVEQQARIVSETDVFVGIHGVGLMWTMLQPAGSVFLEFQYPERWHCLNTTGINVMRREKCETGHITLASNLTHIVYLVPKCFVEPPDSHWNCNIELPLEVMFRLWDAVVCSLAVGPNAAAAECTKYMPATET